MKLAITLALAAFVAYVVYVVVSTWIRETGSPWQRVLATAQHSATILWAKFTAVLAIIAGGLEYVADYLGTPEIGDAIKAAMKPQYVAAFMVLVAIVTIWARKRTL